MNDEGSPREPNGSGLVRRGIFPRRDPSPSEPLLTPTEYRLADTLQRAVDDRLEEGLRILEDQATGLMREVATEVWRSSSKDVRPEQERIVTLLSRDQAIRSLIASSDERFQSLAVRTARLEDHLSELQEHGRQTRAVMEVSAAAIKEIAASPAIHGVETVRSQLELVERHIAEAFAHMDERDKHLTETVLTQVKEHGELIANETTRVVESMQGYVQNGAEAVGRLAQRIEEHAQLFINADHDMTGRLQEIVDAQTDELTEQLAFVREKVGIYGREQDSLKAQLERTLDVRIRGLAELIRSDSIALQGLIQDELASAEAGTMDQRAIVSLVDDRMSALEHIVEERIAALERTLAEQVLALSGATSASLERTLDSLNATAGSVDGLDEMLAETQAAFEERMTTHIDDRMTAIARLIRSDNQVLAEKMTAGSTAGGSDGALDPELLRQVLRSLKELQAGMASDMLGTMDRRFQVMSDQLHHEAQGQAEAMLKIAEVLGEKIDRLSVRVDEGVGSELQIVVDRMSDAIRAMSTAQRRQAS
jgi:hypothetical protein